MHSSKPALNPTETTKLSDLPTGSHTIHIILDEGGAKRFAIEPAYTIWKTATNNLYIAFVLDIFFGGLVAIIALIILRTSTLVHDHSDHY